VRDTIITLVRFPHTVHITRFTSCVPLTMFEHHVCKHVQGVAYSLLSIYRSHNDFNIIFK